MYVKLNMNVVEHYYKGIATKVIDFVTEAMGFATEAQVLQQKL